MVGNGIDEHPETPLVPKRRIISIHGFHLPLKRFTSAI
jgi:hypothetical protein